MKAATVRVVLHGKLAESLLDLAVRSVLLDAEQLVVRRRVGRRLALALATHATTHAWVAAAAAEEGIKGRTAAAAEMHTSFAT